MTTRLSDYDPMGHVNNSVYFDYVETLLFSYLNKERKIKKIKVFIW
jgi:medium-chain acyl-[acyl-carrier-protein] hydrolase